MEIQDFWNTYTGNLTPAELVWQFGKGDPITAIWAFRKHSPSMYGILRRNTWQETFASKEQYNRERIGFALITYLEINRDAWEEQVKELAKAEAEAKLAERKRIEAEALAAAVARVEAEAKESVHEALPNQEQVQAESPPEPISTSDEQQAPHPVYSDGLSQARTTADAQAIAAAMARVEAEAKERASQ